MRALLAVMLIIGISGSYNAVSAGDAVQLLEEAQNEYRRGALDKTLTLIRTALQDVWNQSSLSVQNVTFVTGEPEGYGVYTPRGDNRFETIEPLFLYCEPVGYTQKRMGDHYVIDLKTEFSVVDENGKVAAGPFETAPIVEKTRSFKTESIIFFTFNIKGAPAGDFKLRVTVKDRNSGKKVTFDQPFTVL